MAQSDNNTDPKLIFPLTDVGDYPMFVTFKTHDQRAAIFDIDDRVDALTEAKVNNESTNDSAKPLAKSKKVKPQPAIKGREIRLFIPSQLQFSDGMTYNNFSLGALGAAASESFKSGASLGKVALDTITGEFSGLIDSLKSNVNSEVAAVAAYRTASRRGSDKLAGAVASATQVTVNPNNRMLFNGVANRTFSFSFQLIAKSSEESDRIEEIVEHFRTEMYPTEIVGRVGDTEVAIGYNFPKKWEIRFWDEFADEPIFNKIRPAFLTSMNTTYNSGGATFHEDGKPTSVEITMTFSEDRPLSQSDIKEGY
jgi:hypothetical protein